MADPLRASGSQRVSIDYDDDADRARLLSDLSAWLNEDLATATIEVFDGSPPSIGSRITARRQVRPSFRHSAICAGPNQASTDPLAPLDNNRVVFRKRDFHRVSLTDSKAGVYQLDFRGPMRDSWRELLRELGITLTCFHAPNTYVAELDERQLRALSQVDFITEVRAQATRGYVAPAVEDAIDRADLVEPSDKTNLGVLDVVLHRAGDKGRAKSALEQLPDVLVRHMAERMLTVYLPLRRELVYQIADLVEVKAIYLTSHPRLLLERARVILGVEAIQSDQAQTLTGHANWDGSGEIVAVFDSGVDLEHPDLKDRIKFAGALGKGSAADHYGHGTHVCGIIVGTGAASGGQLRGIAPCASLVSIGVTDESNPLHPRALDLPPGDLSPLLALARQQGANVVNFSWVQNVNGAYEQGADSLDRYLWTDEEMLLVVAAGNSGALHKTVGSPAIAKNVLTVGASISDRSTQPFCQTWAEYNAARFSTAPSATLTMNGSPEMVAAISSRGPSDVLAIKPDVVAPGVWTCSTRSQHAEAQIFQDGGLPSTAPYCFMSGTSMAAPAVAGAALLLRQYLRATLGIEHPSAALIKALLCASCVPLTPYYPQSASRIGYPDFDQGFGRVDLRRVIGTDSKRVEIADVRNQSPAALLSGVSPGGARRAFRRYRFKLKAGSGIPFCAVLVWTDPPGNGLQNTLEFRVFDPATGRWIGGNHDHCASQPADLILDPTEPHYDNRNNAQIIRISEPQAGLWQLRIDARSIPHQPQGYALVVCGDLDSALSVID